MVMPKEANSSEEASSGAKPKELPFVNVHRYLSALEIRVPRILRYDEAEQVMVLEDLTDLTFEQALLSTGKKEQLYCDAIDLLARLRGTSERRPDSQCIAFQRSFDVNLYDWELHHFREWGMEAWSGRKVEGAERSELDQHFQSIAKILAAVPTSFTHRDYQSRNLMVKDGQLVVIDFQDALLGPRQYDLVALLRDSYVELERPFVEEMLKRYASLIGEKDVASFIGFFDLLTVQRKMKDAGRFEFINRVKGNPGFLVSIPASLRYVRDALSRRPELKALRQIVGRYVPELQ
jgi:aminoglycoside/choline kinase family phosphotransferase